MVYIPVVNTAEVSIRNGVTGEQCENTLYFLSSEPITQATLQQLVDDLDTWWYTVMRPYQGNEVVHRETYGVDLTTATGIYAVSLLHTNTPGTHTGSATPNSVSGCVSFRTANRGRSGRGRNYLMGLTIGQVVGSELTTDTVTAYTQMYQQLLDPGFYTDPQWTWAVVSRFADGAARTEGLAQPVLSCGFTDVVVDTQRRRLPGRGA